MDPISAQSVLATAGAAAGDATYVDDVFSTAVYKGNSSGTGSGDEQTITTGIDNTEKSLIWFKNRSGSSDHGLFDTERTSPDYRWIKSNESDAEVQSAAVLKDRTTTGFTVVNAENGSGVAMTNPSNNEKMVAWNFRAMPGFFDVVTYTGTSGNQTISHNLGSVPGMILVKELDQGMEWCVYHRSLGNGKRVVLNSPAAAETNSNYWPSAPTSTTFTVGSDGSNGFNGWNYVAYIFAHDDQSFGTDGDEAIIKCGSYTGNGQASGTAVNLGFEPQWVMIKASGYGNWVMQNTMTGMNLESSQNGVTVGNGLSANTDGAESGYSPNILATSTGFEARNTSSYTNGSGAEYVYIAIRRPHKPPESGTDVFAIDTSDATSPSPPQFTSGFVTDFIIRKTMNGANNQVGSRKQGLKYMSTYSQNQADWGTSLTWDFMDGWSNSSGVDTDLFCYMFKRASGFMDVVTYVGNGTSGRTVSHNLGVVPELMIVKGINYTGTWAVYSSVTGNTKYQRWESREISATTSFWNSTTPTSTQFTLGSNNNVNGSYNYVAYLFATLDGVSKVGSYTGTGYDINVDCGFTAGARFIMIKRTDTLVTGSQPSTWYIYDTTNGIVNNNDDPYWVTHSAVSAVTSTDYIDPLNAGFTVKSTAPAALNASGGTYLFLAIA